MSVPRASPRQDFRFRQNVYEFNVKSRKLAQVMSATKAALKAAKGAIDAQNYPLAIEEAKKVLGLDPKNYHAHVFLGLASEKQGHYDAAEAAYSAATVIREADGLAWQGLVSLYEAQRGEKLDRFHDAAIRLAQIYMADDDRIKCQTVIDKYTLDTKKYGTRSQYKRSLEVLLPDSPVFDYLEGRIPRPDTTFAKIADICETEEREKINTEIGQRRTRLGSKIDQVTAEVRREVFEKSPIEGLYQGVIDWTQDDEVRRAYEEKILKRAGETLAVLSMPQKAMKREQVQNLARGLVILKHPYLLAWKIVLEWTDASDLKDMDVGLLKDFVELFPTEGLAKVLRGFLESDISPFDIIREEQAEAAETEDDNLIQLEERLILMTEGLEESQSSILSHRIMSQYYLFLEEFESMVKVSREGLQCIASETSLCGLAFECSTDAFRVDLATALVQYQAPRHHAEARALFESILKKNAAEASALIGIGLIYEEQEEFSEAAAYLNRALKKNDSPRVRAEAAWCMALNGDLDYGLQQLESCLPEVNPSDMRNKTLRAQTHYRIGKCIWNQDTSSHARKDRSGAYARFISSLQADLNFAPAYTSLGLYYADYAKDKKRAKKCFLKAFELSVSELQAAERLARSSAKSADWDEVEAIAQRVIASGKFRAAPGSKKKTLSWPYAALGIVQLNHQEYPKSIVSFQSALRITPEDHHCWIGLGESYHHSGRYVAAARAFEHGEQVQSAANKGNDDFWFSRYMLANVKRELGEYEDAIGRYNEVLTLRKDEFGVLVALLQCLVESAWHDIALGFFGRAANRAIEAIEIAIQVAELQTENFNLWKAVGDASAMFIRIPSYVSDSLLVKIGTILKRFSPSEAFEILEDYDQIGQSTLDQLTSPKATDKERFEDFARAAILAQKRAIHAGASDMHIRAIAWYNLGWTEYLAYSARSDEHEQELKEFDLQFLKAAVQCFKRAIEIEAGNAEFWNALGIVTRKLSPKVSQHSFIRSLYLNDKNARVWTNLGAFYLIQNDLQLANEAFTRAQSVDPDFAEAWLGQGLLAEQMGELEEARGLLSHAFEISDASSILIKQHYVLSALNHLFSSPSAGNSTDILRSLLGLRQLHKQTLPEVSFEHLKALFAERIGDFQEALSSLLSSCAALETEYEDAESPSTLLKFAQAKADLARAQLAEHEFEKATDSAEMALDLSDESGASGHTVQSLRLSAQMTAGLASYYQKSIDSAIEMFKKALTETDGNPDVICLLSQILWAKGGEVERDVAREQLLNCIEKHPGHIGSTILLGAIAVLDEDEDILVGVTAELQGLRADDSLASKERDQIAELLTRIAVFQSADQGQGGYEKSEALTAVMLAPSQPQGWSQLSAVTGDAFPAETAVHVAVKAVAPHGSLEAEGLSSVFAGSGRAGDAQKAIMFAPWKLYGWETLQSIQSQA